MLMNTAPIPTALQSDWDKLPRVLQLHYAVPAGQKTKEHGYLDISYPRFMQPVLSILSRFGALIDRPGDRAPTKVVKYIEGSNQIWRRVISFEDEDRTFNSWVEHTSGNQVVEYVNSFLGMKMLISTDGEVIRYHSNGYVIKLGGVRVPWPEFLALGRADIIERPVDEQSFDMDFTLRHPIFGQLFRYSGRFRVGDVV